jgi:phosphatidylethanolamine/phosphatidyl-N-methylethanolamine N-methyltransferase
MREPRAARKFLGGLRLPRSILFFGQLLRHRRQTGAVLPSGQGLARAMVEAIGPLPEQAAIIELGPGTGVFTRAIQRRYPANRLVAVEANPEFVSRLRADLPTVPVVLGCASVLGNHLAAHHIARSDVGAVISGLPLLSLPGDLPQRILAAIAEVLPAGRQYVQFTYAPHAWRRFDLPGFTAGPRRRVWLNIPPATVLRFIRQ